MTNPTELCERLQEYADEDLDLGYKTNRAKLNLDAKALIESQAKQIADYASIVKQQAMDYISLFDQCSEALDRVKALEAKCALLAASLAQAEREKDDAEKHAAEVSNANFDLEAKVAAAEKAKAQATEQKI